METATSSSGKIVTSHVGRNLTTYNVKRHNFTKNKSLGQIVQRKGKMNWSAPASIKLPPSTSSKTPSSNSEENALFSASAFYGSKSKESPQKKCFNFVLLSNQVVMKKQTKMYACDVCSAMYRHVFSLKRHFLRNHVTVKYISKSDLSNCKIITHDQPDSALIANDSDESSLSSRSSESKKRHRSGELANLNEGMEGLYRCHLCPDLKFDTKLELKSHYLLHPKSSKVRFPCSKCGAVFSHKQTLLRHLLTHANSSTFTCKTCGKRFDNKASYLKHAYTHTDSRRCKYCSKILSTSANKRRHERIHEGLKPYPCKRCEAQFSQSGDLKKHLKLQHQVSYFSCTLCRAVFSSKIALTKHTTDSHSSEIIPKNPNSEVLPSSTNHVQFSKEVKEKQEVIAPKTFSCTVCKKVCTTYISMLRHRRQNHPFLHTRKVHKKLKFSQNTCKKILRRRRNSPQRTEEDFYLSISSMIADNLLNHVDGKTSQLSLRQYNFIDQMEQCTPIPTHPWSCYNFPSNFDVDLALRNRGHEIKNRSCESILPFTDTYAPNGFECFNCDSNGVYDFSNYYNSEVSDSEDLNNNSGSTKLTDIDVEERKKLIGREVKSVLVCCACRDKFSSREAFNNHCENNHPNVLCTYIEIEGDSESPPVVPENLSWQFLNPVGVYFSCSVPPPISEKPSISCTKCMSVFSTAPELHQHIVHCGGIQTPVKHVRKLFPERKIKLTMKSRINTSLKPRFIQNKVSKPEEEAPQVPKATASSNLDMHSKMYKNLMDFRPKPSVGRPRLNLCINCPHCTQTFRTKTLLNAHISGCYRSKFHKRKYSRANHVLNQKGTSTSSECSKSSDLDNHLLTNKGRKKLNVVNSRQTELKQKTLTFQANKTLPVSAGQRTLGNDLKLNKQSQTTNLIPPQSSTKSPQNTASLPIQITPLPKSVKHKPKEALVNDKPVVRESLTMHIALLPTPSIKRMSSKEAPLAPLTPAKELALKTLIEPKECLVNAVPAIEQPIAAQPMPLPKLSLKHKLPKGAVFNSAFSSPKSVELSNRPANHPVKSSTSLTASLTKPLTEQKTLKENSESSQTTNESISAQPMLTGFIPNASNSLAKPDHTLKETVSKSVPSVGDLLPNVRIVLDSALTTTKINLVPVKKTKLSDASAISATVSSTGFKSNTNVITSIKDPLSTGTVTDEANVLNLTRSSIKKAVTICKPVSKGQTSIKEASNIPNVSSSKPEETMFIPVSSTAKDSMSNNVSGMSASICPALIMDVNNHPVDPKIDSPRERLSPSLEVLINSINEKLHSDELSPSNPTFSWMEDEHIIVPLSKRFLSNSSLHPEVHQENLVPSTELDEVREVVNDVIGKVEYRMVQDLSPPDLEPHCKPSIDNVLKDVEFKFKEIGIPVPKETLSQVSSAILPSTSSDLPLKMSFELVADESTSGTTANEQPIPKKSLGLRSFRRSRKRSIPSTSNISLSKEISSSNSRMLNHEKPKQNKPIRCSLCLLDFKYTMNYKRHLKSCRDKHLEKDNPEQPSKSPCMLHLPKKDEVEESMLNLLRHQSRQSQIMKEAKPDDTDDGKRLLTYTCDICHKIFLSLFKLLQHRVVHKLQNADDTGLAGNDNASPERNPQIKDQTVDGNQEKGNSSNKTSISKISNERSEVDTKTSDVHVLLQHMVKQITLDAEPSSAIESEQSITELPESQNVHENTNGEESSSTSNHCIIDLSLQEKNLEPFQDIPSGSVDALNVIPVKEIGEVEADKGISDQNRIADEAVIGDNKNNLTSGDGDNFKEPEVLEKELLEPIKNENVVDEMTKGAEYQGPPILEVPMDLSQTARLKIKRNVFTHAKPRARKRCWGRKNWIIKKTHVKSTSIKKKTETSTVDIAVMPQTVIPSTSNDQKKPVVKRRFNKITTKQKPVQKRKKKKIRRDLSSLILRSGLSKSKPTGTKQTINSHIKIRRKYKRTIVCEKATKKSCDLKTDETVLEIPDFPPQEVVIADVKSPKPLKRKYTRRKFPIKSVSVNANNKGNNIKPTVLVTESSSAADENSTKHSPLQVLESDKTPQHDNGNSVVKMRKKRKKVKKIVVRKRGGLKVGQIVKKSPVEIPTTSTEATNLVQDIAESKPKVKRGRKKVIKSECPPEKPSSSNTLSNSVIEDIKDTKPVIKPVKRRKNSTRFNSVDIQDGKKDSLHDSSPTASSLPVTIKVEVESEVSDQEKGDDESISMAPIVSKPPPKKPAKMRGRPPNTKCPFCLKVFYSLNYKKRHIEMKHKRQKPKEKVAAKAKLLKRKRRAFKRQCKTGPAFKKVRETKIALPLKKK